MQAIVEAVTYKMNIDFFKIGEAYTIRFNSDKYINGICFRADEELVSFMTVDGNYSFGPSDFFEKDYSIRRMAEVDGDENVCEHGTLKPANGELPV